VTAARPSSLAEAGYVERVPAGDDRRRIVVTLTPAGRKLVKKIHATRQGLFDFARSLMKGVDVDATLHLFRELLQYSDYNELVARRRGLEEVDDGHEVGRVRTRAGKRTSAK